MPDALARAVSALAHDELVVYPTDTLPGLAASARSAKAVARLLEAKSRPGGMPISLAVASVVEAEPWVVLSRDARALARRLLPGPWTLLLPASTRARRELARPLVAADGTVGLRVPDHPVARALAARAGPVTATSANRHGEPTARTLAEARRALGARVAVYLALDPPPSGRPSTLVDLAHGAPTVRARS